MGVNLCSFLWNWKAVMISYFSSKLYAFQGKVLVWILLMFCEKRETSEKGKEKKIKEFRTHFSLNTNHPFHTSTPLCGGSTRMAYPPMINNTMPTHLLPFLIIYSFDSCLYLSPVWNRLKISNMLGLLIRGFILLAWTPFCILTGVLTFFSLNVFMTEGRGRAYLSSEDPSDTRSTWRRGMSCSSYSEVKVLNPLFDLFIN